MSKIVPDLVYDWELFPIKLHFPQEIFTNKGSNLVYPDVQARTFGIIKHNMSELDDRVKQVQAAYDEAVKDGSIDPKRMDIERFADILADDITYFDSPSSDAAQDEADSERAVANLQNRGGKFRQAILDKWFGKKDSD